MAVVGAAAIGILAALGAGTPAFACHPIIDGKAACDQAGKVEITWTVGNSEATRNATVVSTSLPVSGIKVADALLGTADPKYAVLTGTTTHTFVAGGSATLTVALHWDAQGTNAAHDESKSLEVKFGDVPCGPVPTPGATYTPKCDGTVTVVVHNPLPEAFKVEVSGTGAWTTFVEVPAAGDSAPFTVPAANAGTITLVRVTKDGVVPVGNGFTYQRPQECGVPDVSATAACDGKSLLIKNPAGNASIEAVVTAGSLVTKVEVAAGKTATVKLPLDTLTVEVKIGDSTSTVRFDTPKNCTPPPAAPGPTLPVTGANVGLLAGGALGLMGVGGSLFWMARRRRIQFTA